MEFEDEETKEISGTIGQADTREECEGFLEYEMGYHHSHGRIVLNAEATEVCAKCDGEGKLGEQWERDRLSAMPVAGGSAQCQVCWRSTRIKPNFY